MGIGLGTGYLSPVKTLMLWFADRKGLATGLAVAGFGAAKAIASPIMQALLANLGEGGIYKMFFILAIVYFIMMFVGHILLAKPEGWHEPSGKESKPSIVQVLKTRPIINYIGIWLMFYINITCGLALISQEKMIVKCIGLAGAVGIISTISAIFNAGGRLGFSAWADTMKDRNTVYKMIFILSIAFTAIVCLTGGVANGEGNVVRFPAQEVAVIDHHMLGQPLPRLNRVDSTLGSCCTLVWKMLKEVGFDVNKNKYLATALYYGLYMDTGFMEEIYHMEDMKFRDTINFDHRIMHKLRNSNISIDDLETAGAALLRTDYVEKYNFGLVKTSPCDPNVLGIISDLVLEVDAIDSCVVFALLEAGVKLSVRSCVEEIRANEMVMAICDGIGSGGGHVRKAGGFIPIQQATQEYLRICDEFNIPPRMELDENGSQNRPSASGIKVMLERRANRYFDSIEYTPKEV